MKPNHSYVLPLSEPAVVRYAPEEMGPGVAIASVGEPKPGEYEMPGCAESGFELVDGKSYLLVNTYFAVMMCLFSAMVISGAVPTPWM